MKRDGKTIRLAAWLAAASIVFGAAENHAADNPRDILIIVNLGASVGDVTIDQVRDIFLKKRTDWGSGLSAVPVHARKGSPLRRDFLEHVLKISQDQEDEYWAKMTIRFGFPGPPEFANTLKAVFRLRGAVSYVYRGEYKEGVAKVLFVVPVD
ncbi:MAG: hypothetical protein PHU25_02515 [Deltaproteobacteria bacterium]|nr:hypothetical protein [Deltaproteobacteria bacterium]